MVVITINKNRDNKICIENEGASLYMNKLTIHNNHITYNFYSKLFSVSFYNNYYYKRFCINCSYYKIYKNFLCKKRLLNIKINIYDILYYSYFIYNKYCSYLNEKGYNIYTLTSKKIFNCRDYYKIYSYIIATII